MVLNVCYIYFGTLQGLLESGLDLLSNIVDLESKYSPKFQFYGQWVLSFFVNLWFCFPFGWRIFETWCLHIPVMDRTPFIGPPLSLTLFAICYLLVTASIYLRVCVPLVINSVALTVTSHCCSSMGFKIFIEIVRDILWTKETQAYYRLMYL